MLESEAQLKERLATWTMDQLVTEGYCLPGVIGFWSAHNSYGKPTVNFSLGPGEKFPSDNKFE